MIYSIVSLGLMILAVALLAGVLLVPVAFLAGNVSHIWGTSSTLEWISEAFLRVFAGTLRRRLMWAINQQCSVGVDRSRKAHPYLAVLVSPAAVGMLTGPGGDLAGLASDAVKGYVRHARAEGWTSGAIPQIAVVSDELLRRGSVKVRPVSGPEFTELRREMAAWDEAVYDDDVLPVPAPAQTTRLVGEERFRTQQPSAADAVTVEVSPIEVVTEAFGSGEAVTMPAGSVRMVLSDTHGKRHPITSESVLIGRGPECGIRLENVEVSREHVGVYFQEGSWWLRDRGSRNGTTVGGRQIKGTGPVQLRRGSQIVLGGERAGEKLTIADLEER